MKAFSAGKRHVYDVVNRIHDVITTLDPLAYTAKFIFFGVTNNKTKKKKNQTLKDK